eukprot:PhF_6_TR37126/c0_g1_i6/m.54592
MFWRFIVLLVSISHANTKPLFGIGYTSPSDPTIANVTNQMYYSFLSKGATLLQVSLPWASIEAQPGVIDYDRVATLLQEARAAGLTPLFNLATMDTSRISVPSDLADSTNPLELAPGLRWSDDVVATRYTKLLDVIAPLVQYSGGWYFGFGNEVDGILSAGVNATTAWDYVVFVAKMRNYVQTITSHSMMCGVTMTAGFLGRLNSTSSAWVWVQGLMNVSDATPITFYPIGDGVRVIEPHDAAVVLNSTLALLKNRPIIIQELGCPSGYDNASSVDGSSEAYQQQFFNASVTTLLSRGEQVLAIGIFSFFLFFLV